MANHAGAIDETWFFKPEEIAIAHRYQENYRRRLRQPLKPKGCYTGDSEFVASYQGREFSAPCRFIFETTRHLKFILEKGAAKYLFPMDADQWFAELLREPKPGALYHTAEHLDGSYRQNGKENYEVRNWRAERNVLGFFDGGPLEILSAGPDGAAREKPERFINVGTIHFLAHRLGETVFSVNGKAVPFDLSFDDDVANLAP